MPKEGGNGKECKGGGRHESTSQNGLAKERKGSQAKKLLPAGYSIQDCKAALLALVLAIEKANSKEKKKVLVAAWFMTGVMSEALDVLKVYCSFFFLWTSDSQPIIYYRTLI